MALAGEMVLLHHQEQICCEGKPEDSIHCAIGFVCRDSVGQDSGEREQTHSKNVITKGNATWRKGICLERLRYLREVPMADLSKTGLVRRWR